MKYDIFISYRREGGYETAKHLYDLLTRDGYYVSFDIDTLRNGDFDKELLRRIEQCTDFILILSRDAFSRTLDPSFDSKKDWLRNELAYALAKEKNIIPIMLSGFTEFPGNLPEDIARVQRKNGPKYDQYYFDTFYEKLKKVFIESTPLLKPSQTISETSDFKLSIVCDETAQMYIDQNMYGKIKGGKMRIISGLQIGKSYDLRFNSLAIKEDCLNIQYAVPEGKASDVIKVSFADRRKQRIQKELENKSRIKKEKADWYEREGRLKQCIRMYDNYCYGTKEDMIAVQKNGYWGFLNKEGFEVIPCIYKEYVEFNEGFCFVMKDDEQWICLDKNGFEQTNLQSDEPSIVYGGLCLIIKNGKYMMTSPAGQRFTNFEYDVLIRTDNPNIVIAKTREKYLFVEVYKGQYLLNSLSFESVGTNRLDSNTQHVYSSLYIQTSLKYNLNLTIILFPMPVVNKGRFGFVNGDLKLSIPCVAEGINGDWADRTILKVNGKLALANVEKGQYIVPPIYDFMRYYPCSDTELFSVGIDCAVSSDGWRAIGGLQGVIDADGKIVVPLVFQQTFVHENNTIIAVKYDGETRGHWEKSTGINESFVWDLRPKSEEVFKFDYTGKPIK